MSLPFFLPQTKTNPTCSMRWAVWPPFAKYLPYRHDGMSSVVQLIDSDFRVRSLKIQVNRPAQWREHAAVIAPDSWTWTSLFWPAAQWQLYRHTTPRVLTAQQENQSLFLLSHTHRNPLIWLGWTTSRTTNSVCVCGDAAARISGLSLSHTHTQKTVLLCVQNDFLSGAEFHCFNDYILEHSTGSCGWKW